MFCHSHLEIHSNFWTRAPQVVKPVLLSVVVEIDGMSNRWDAIGPLLPFPALILFNSFVISLMTLLKLLRVTFKDPYVLPYTCFSLGVSGSLTLVNCFHLHRMLLTSHPANSYMSFKTRLCHHCIHDAFSWPQAWAMAFSSAPVAPGTFLLKEVCCIILKSLVYMLASFTWSSSANR